MEKYIYYSGQRNWTWKDYQYLNNFLNKLFLYHELPKNQYRIRHMNVTAMEETTQAILKAVLLTQGVYKSMIKKYKNLVLLENVKPLKTPLFLTDKKHFNIFEEYKKLNIIL